MGLDIRHTRKLVPAPEAELDADGYIKTGKSSGARRCIGMVRENWPADRRSRGIAYSFGDSLAFRAGSYGGYNDGGPGLRGSQAIAMAEHFWAKHCDAPFYCLINFADNGGVVIGRS